MGFFIDRRKIAKLPDRLDLNRRWIAGAALAFGAYTHASRSMAQGYIPSGLPRGSLNLLTIPGVDPTGATSSTSGVQTALSTGRTIFAPAGSYLISSGLVATSGGIIGEGAASIYNSIGTQTGATVFYTNDATSSNVFQYNLNSYSSGAPIFRDFSIAVYQGISRATTGGINGTGGYLLVIGDTNGSGAQINFGADISNVNFYINTNSQGGAVPVSSAPNFLLFQNSAAFAVKSCRLSGYSAAGLTTNCDEAPDDGDSFIGAGCQFNGGTGGTGILQQRAGGLKIEGNKFNGGAYGYQFVQNNAVASLSTTILIISSSSFENMTTACIDFQNLISGTSFGKIAIGCCQADLSTRIVYFETPSSGNAWRNIVISGNTFQANASGNLIEFNACDRVVFSANEMDGQGIAGSTPIYIASSCSSNGLYGASSPLNGIYQFANSVSNNASWT